MASTVLDLSDLASDLQITLNAPGENAYSTVSEDEWVNRLRNAFWDAVLDGLIPGYSESEGLISPIDTSGVLLARDQQQLIIMYAAISIVRNQLLTLKTVFRAKSGNNEFETQQSAIVLKALLDEFSSRRIYILGRLADTGIARDTYYIDSYTSRQQSYDYAYTSWIGA